MKTILERSMPIVILLCTIGLMAGCSNQVDETDELKSAIDQETNDVSPEIPLSATIYTDLGNYNGGGNITVTYKVSDSSALSPTAWIGLLSSSVEHDDVLLAKQSSIDDVTIIESSGSVYFNAPSQSGTYEVRVYSGDANDDIELASSSFSVVNVDKEITLTVDKPKYQVGEIITVEFSGVDELGDSAWIGLLPYSVTHGIVEINDENDLEFINLDGKESGTVTFTAPDKAGLYDVRLNSSRSTDAEEITYKTFNVVE